MIATIIDSSYPDLQVGREYKIKRVWSNYHITLEGSPRLYDMRSFEIKHKGQPISYVEAYRMDCINRAMKEE